MILKQSQPRLNGHNQEHADSLDVLAKVRSLVDALNADGIRYCHWKSNIDIAKSLAGKTDIDLLVDRQDATHFRAILSQLQFRPVVLKGVKPFPAVEHHIALDEASGTLVHVHAYYQVITGESLTKNYRFPIEEMLLRRTRSLAGMPLPHKSAELVVFTLRIMLKHTALVELIMLARYWKQVQPELEWLLQEATPTEAVALVERWLPALDRELFSDCLQALAEQAPLRQRIALARQLRAQLVAYRRLPAYRARIDGVKKFATMFLQRFIGSKVSMAPPSGGAVIAFVGSEATGKSTLQKEIADWLSDYFSVERIHAGKPRSTVVSAVPNTLLPLLRRLLPSHRTTNVETHYAGDEVGVKAGVEPQGSGFSLFFGVRSVLLGFDRRALLARAFGRAAGGRIVLCDRYPSQQAGAPDSPQLRRAGGTAAADGVRGWLTAAESQLYRRIASPDLIIYLSAPLDVTIQRNASRGKREPEDYVRRRHARSSNLQFSDTPVYRINTDQPLSETILQIKRAVWHAL